MAFITNSAFPGALGHGRRSYGGSGRHLSTPTTQVLRVTNLNNAGAGSLRAAIEAVGPRTIIFEISGTIVLTDQLIIDNPYCTIAGQTAPSPGITLRGAGLTIRTNDVVVRHLRGRPGDDLNGTKVNRDAFNMSGHSGRHVRNCIVANCSASWTTDQLYTGWVWSGGTLEDITYQDMLGGEPLHDSIHSEGHPHSYGPTVGGSSASPQRVSYIRNLFVHCTERNPRIGRSNKSVEVINCGAFNWQNRQTSNCNNSNGLNVPLMIDFIGNCYKAGVRSWATSYALLSDGNINSGSRIYAVGNVCPQRPSDTGDEWDAVSNDIPEGTHKSLTRVANSGDGYSAMAPLDAYDWLVLNAGARPNDRDSVDVRIAGDAENLTGTGPPDHPSDVGGWPVLAVNRVTHQLPANYNAEGTGGYTVLENWLEEFHLALQSSEPTPPIPTPPPPDPNPDTDPGAYPSSRVTTVESPTARFAAYRYIGVNGTTLSTSYVDSRTKQLASSEVITKLKD